MDLNNIKRGLKCSSELKLIKNVLYIIFNKNLESLPSTYRVNSGPSKQYNEPNKERNQRGFTDYEIYFNGNDVLIVR